MRTIHLSTFREQFAALVRTPPDLAGFTDPAAVLDVLHDWHGDGDAKDRILAALVRETKNTGAGRDVAVTLLWLALWPGLDAVYRRLLRHFRTAPADLVSDIAGHFTMVVHRADLTRIRRVAATLVANLERDIRKALSRRWAETARHQPLPADDMPLHDHVGSWRGLPLRSDIETMPMMVRDVLAGTSDADIVAAVVVIGETQREVADRLGLGHDAVRKRYQRSLRRLRDALEFF